MSKFIDLERSFHELTDKELEDAESLISLGEFGSYLSIGLGRFHSSLLTIFW